MPAGKSLTRLNITAMSSRSTKASVSSPCVSTGASYRWGDSAGGGVAALYVTRLRRRHVKPMWRGPTFQWPMRRAEYDLLADWCLADSGTGPGGDLLRTSLQRATHWSQMYKPGPATSFPT